MAPKKRKLVPVDSDSDDSYAAPTKSARRKSTTATAASSSKKPVSASKSNPDSVSNYTAKLVTPEYKEIQTRCCHRYTSTILGAKPPDKCSSCTEKQAISGGCRFINLRVFRKVNRKTDYSDYAFRTNLDLFPRRSKKVPEKKVKKAASRRKPTRKATRSKPAPLLELANSDTDEKSETEENETEENIAKAPGTDITPTELKANYVLPLIAPTFAEQLRREKHHEFTHLGLPVEGAVLPGSPRPLIRILSIPESRSLCDACATSIYMGSYLCGCCGSELCLGCWEEWEPSDAREGGRFRSRDICSMRRRHVRDSMVFVSRAADGEISKLLERAESYIPSVEKQEQENGDATLDIDSIPTSQPSWPNEKGPKYLPTPKVHHSELTLRQFQALWRKGGIPLVLTGFLGRFKLLWDPAYFIANHGGESCFIHDCIDGTAMESTVAEFFSKFSDPTCTESHKLKDWPPSADFSTTFPKLFNDFESALPFPSYTARKGTLNLAAHFPEGYNAPDLGPKMYNAYPAPDFLPDIFSPKKGKGEKTEDVKGTTNLHLDLTDAMNIMLFAAGGTLAPTSATASKGIPACGAVWDIFPPSASSAIRTYLNSPAYIASHPDARPQDDPIHRQCYYLTEADLTTLYRKYRVQSHRIFQEPGDAVFIPAGCCHQVRNRRSCVKVAVDFLTPENVKVCRGLVEEARNMAGDFGRGRRGKEDVLQLWACLGFAWGFYDNEGVKKVGMVEDGIKDGDATGEVVGSEDVMMADAGDDANEGREEVGKADAKEEEAGERHKEMGATVMDAGDPKGGNVVEERKPSNDAESNEVSVVQVRMKVGPKEDIQPENARHPEAIQTSMQTKLRANLAENGHPAKQSTRTKVEFTKTEPHQAMGVEANESSNDNITETAGRGGNSNESAIEA